MPGDLLCPESLAAVSGHLYWLEWVLLVGWLERVVLTVGVNGAVCPLLSQGHGAKDEDAGESAG